MTKLIFLAAVLTACTADTFSGDDAAQTDAATDHEFTDAGPQQDGSKPDSSSDAPQESSQDAFSDGKDDAPEAPEADAGGVGICGYKDQGTCAHFLCTQGVALVSGCDPDGYVAYICMFKDSACCSSSWSATCVSLAAGVLGISCSGC
jgi:hypothetical protein